jgi:ribosomal protein S18 acetylase RimI-like enzyme
MSDKNTDPAIHTMTLVCLHDRSTLDAFLRDDARVHLYELGDLDDFFFRHTQWWGLEDRGRLAAVALLYAASELPVLMALGRDRDPHVRALLERIRPFVSRRVYAHLAVGTADALGPAFRLEPRGLHDRMVLVDPTRLDDVDSREAVRLGPSDAHDLETFYASAYPNHWFDARMLETGAYRGVRRDGRIVSVAGVHVLSRERRVAAIGNVATNAAYRGKGLARVSCAALCKDLLGTVDVIGLNVLSSDPAAIGLYEDLGFARVASYDEIMVTST